MHKAAASDEIRVTTDEIEAYCAYFSMSTYRISMSCRLDVSEATAEIIKLMPSTFVDFTLFTAISMPITSTATAEANTIMFFSQNKNKMPMSEYI